MIELSRSAPPVERRGQLLDIILVDARRAGHSQLKALDAESRRYLEFIQHQRRALGLMRDRWVGGSKAVDFVQASASDLSDWLSRAKSEADRRGAVLLFVDAAVSLLRSSESVRTHVLVPRGNSASRAVGEGGDVGGRVEVRRVLQSVRPGDVEAAFQAARHLLDLAEEADDKCSGLVTARAWMEWYRGDVGRVGGLFEGALRVARSAEERAKCSGNLALWLNETRCFSESEKMALAALKMGHPSPGNSLNLAIWSTLNGRPSLGRQVVRDVSARLGASFLATWPIGNAMSAIEANVAIRGLGVRDARSLKQLFREEVYSVLPGDSGGGWDA